MKIGTQAIEGMARSAWMEGSSSRRAVSLAPVSMPISVPATAPMPKPMATRVMVAATCVCSSPEAASATAVCSRRDGGGIRRPGAMPVRTASSQAMPSATGTASAVIQPRSR